MQGDLLLVTILFQFLCLFLGLKALVEDALELRVDLKLFKRHLCALVRLSFITVGEHLDQ